MNEAQWDAAVAAARAARLAAWKRLGTPDVDVLAPILNPIFMGGPAWPSRPAWRVIRRPKSTILASDALSDPWMEGERLGQRLEVLIEVPGEVRDVRKSPFLSALMELSHTAAANDLRSLLERLGVVSVEVSGEPFPKALRNADGRVGFLLGVRAQGVPEKVKLPGGEVMLVVATLLNAEQLDAVSRSPEARIALAGELSTLEGGHLSFVDAKAAVKKKKTPAKKKKSPAKKPKKKS
jgi:hypothetical protein